MEVKERSTAIPIRPSILPPTASTSLPPHVLAFPRPRPSISPPAHTFTSVASTDKTYLATPAPCPPAQQAQQIQQPQNTHIPTVSSTQISKSNASSISPTSSSSSSSTTLRPPPSVPASLIQHIEREYNITLSTTFPVVGDVYPSRDAFQIAYSFAMHASGFKAGVKISPTSKHPDVEASCNMAIRSRNPIPGTLCRCRTVASPQKQGRWVVTSVDSEHNHKPRTLGSWTPLLAGTGRKKISGGYRVEHVGRRHEVTQRSAKRSTGSTSSENGGQDSSDVEDSSNEDDSSDKDDSSDEDDNFAGAIRSSSPNLQNPNRQASISSLPTSLSTDPAVVRALERRYRFTLSSQFPRVGDLYRSRDVLQLSFSYALSLTGFKGCIYSSRSAVNSTVTLACSNTMEPDDGFDRCPFRTFARQNLAGKWVVERVCSVHNHPQPPDTPLNRQWIPPSLAVVVKDSRPIPLPSPEQHTYESRSAKRRKIESSSSAHNSTRDAHHNLSIPSPSLPTSFHYPHSIPQHSSSSSTRYLAPSKLITVPLPPPNATSNRLPTPPRTSPSPQAPNQVYKRLEVAALAIILQGMNSLLGDYAPLLFECGIDNSESLVQLCSISTKEELDEVLRGMKTREGKGVPGLHRTFLVKGIMALRGE